MSILSGLILAVGCIVMMSKLNNIIASFLFSFGLSTIILREYFLYTGKIGFYDQQGKNFLEIVKNLSLILIINITTIYFVCFLYSYFNIEIKEVAKIAVIKKININLGLSFLNAVGCGMMMFLAVDNYRKSQNFLMVIMPIMIFILVRFEHCIANVGYIGLSHVLNIKITIYLFLWILGNSLGSIIFAKLENNK